MGRMLHFAGPKFSAYIVEFIGTFFLVLTIGLNTAPKNDPNSMFAPLAIGSMLMVMIFMGGHISGAHYNPAVTLGVRLTGRDHIATSTAIVYASVQILGGIVASLVVYGITDNTFGPGIGEGYNAFQALTVEFLYSFALVSVMLNSATTKSQNANSFFGLAIGFTVLSGAYSVGPISGACFNPAVGTGPIIVDALLGQDTLSKLHMIWIYWVGPIVGAILAAIVFRVTNTAEFRKATSIADVNSSKKNLQTTIDEEEHLIM